MRRETLVLKEKTVKCVPTCVYIRQVAFPLIQNFLFYTICNVMQILRRLLLSYIYKTKADAYLAYDLLARWRQTEACSVQFPQVEQLFFLRRQCLVRSSDFFFKKDLMASRPSCLFGILLAIFSPI